MKRIRFSDYHGPEKLSVEQRLHRLYPSANDTGYGSDGLEDLPELSEEESVSSQEDTLDSDEDELQGSP